MSTAAASLRLISMKNLNKVAALKLDHLLDAFSKRYESLLGFVRKEMQGQVVVTHSLTNSKGKVVQAKFPPVRSTLKGSTIGFDKKASHEIAKVVGFAEKLKESGADHAYTDRVIWLLKESSYYQKDLSSLKSVAQMIMTNLKIDFKDGQINNIAPEEGTKQYMEGTALDQFLLGLERLLGFSRVKSANDKGVFTYDLEQVSVEQDAAPVVRPVLYYSGQEKPFSAKNKKMRWGNIPRANRDYYRSIAISNFRNAVSEIFKSGELDRYYVNVIDMVSRRLRLLKEDESPLALSEAVKSYYQSWFLRSGSKVKTSGQSLDQADLHRAGQTELFNPDYLMHDDETGLDYANGLDSNQSCETLDDDDEEELLSPEEEEAALNRLTDSGFDIIDV